MHIQIVSKKENNEILDDLYYGHYEFLYGKEFIGCLFKSLFKKNTMTFDRNFELVHNMFKDLENNNSFIYGVYENGGLLAVFRIFDQEENNIQIKHISEIIFNTSLHNEKVEVVNFIVNSIKNMEKEEISIEIPSRDKVLTEIMKNLGFIYQPRFDDGWDVTEVYSLNISKEKGYERIRSNQ